MDDELIIRGSLEDATLPELLRSICKSKESGVLTCFVRDHKKSVFVHKGQIIFASSSFLDDRLGEFLLRSGRITVRAFVEATKNVRPGRRLGAILCESNAISPDDLVESVREQVRGIIHSLFGALKGTYELILKEIDTQEMIVLNTPSEDTIFDAVKSITSWSRISKGIGSFSNVFVPAHDSEKILLNLSLSSEETHLFSLCEKGRFSVEEICGMSYFTNFETCRTLWSFLLIGALEAHESVDSSGEAPRRPASSFDLEADLHDLVEKYNDLYSHIYEYARHRLGEEVETLTERAMLQVYGSMPNVTRNLRLDLYGRADFDTFLVNLSPVPEEGRYELLTAALEEIVYALLFEVGSQFGSDEQTRLTREIQNLRHR